VLGTLDEKTPVGAYDEPTQRRDSQRIALPAGAGLEFKLYMRAGDTLEYSWTARDFLQYDFHGEETGAPPDAFTSHKQGEARQDSDGFVAPFTGTHGWYWLNRSSQDLEVTLLTEGVYSVVGFV
jgi:hypothetical protein